MATEYRLPFTGSQIAEKLQQVENLEADYDVLNARVNSLVANSGEQTEGNEELIDIRVGFDRTEYESAGEAVRGQARQLDDKIKELSEVLDTAVFSVNGQSAEKGNVRLEIATDHLVNYAVTTDKLAESAVTTDKLAEEVKNKIQKGISANDEIIGARTIGEQTYTTLKSAIESVKVGNETEFESVRTDVIRLEENIQTVENEIAIARELSNGEEKTLAKAISSAYDNALEDSKNYSDLLQASSVVLLNDKESLPIEGEGKEFTIYFVPKDSGNGYDKYMYVGQGQSQKLDVFSGSSTLIVEDLPEEPNVDVDYILKTNSGYLYYKYIENNWELIAGSSAYVGGNLPDINMGSELTDYYILSENGTYIHYRFIDGNFKVIGGDTYTKTEIDEKFITKTGVDDLLDPIEEQVGNNKTNISSLSTSVEGLENTLNSIDTSPRLTYDIVYNDINDENSGENKLVFYEITNEGKEGEVKTPKKIYTITGGSGGSTSANNLRITYVTRSPVIATINDKVLITYNYSGLDSTGDSVTGYYTWKIGTNVIATGEIENGDHTFDATAFASTTKQTFTLSVTDSAGNLATKQWQVQLVDVRLTSTFNDTRVYGLNNISFNYTPYGAIQKEVHFVLDGVEIGTETVTSSGIPKSYTIPAQTHGAHLLEVYMTTTINNVPIESNHIFKDIICQDPASNIPIVGCAMQDITITQHNTVNIKYVVVDPSTETPQVTWKLNGEVIGEELLTEKDESGYFIYSYKAREYGDFILSIFCGEAEPKEIRLTVKELDIDVSPVMGGLAFDFNPAGYSNSSANRLWTYNDDIKMQVSENFDWINGGYQIDENGDKYFCVKAKDRATITYNLFANDPKLDGKEFKVIFRTKNIRKRDTSFLNCYDNNIGLDMRIEHAIIHSSDGLLKADYCEDTIIEYEFNINKMSDMMIVMSYEDGAPSKPYEYKSTSSFKQNSPRPIVIGSDDCDIHIYRMKAYSTSLTDEDIKNNFIADARNADEMIARYNRNQIYTDGNLVTTSANGGFNAQALMEAAPDLRYIFLEVPQFTKDKDNKIDGCTVYFRYPAGTRPQDNWTCTGMRHRGQGTSSNLYGYAGRNIDLCMDRSDSLFTWDDVDENGKPIVVESRTITLTDTSIPTDYLNIKVNIASSENANNAQLARRFNEYQPFLRYARKKDERVKDTMEFYNCVVFIRETGDKSIHREFEDTDWHFYAIGNIGDSKKTDDTRVNNPNDPKEHVVEIMDADVALASFPTGKDGNVICPPNEWKENNSAYDILYSQDYVYDDEGAFKGFGINIDSDGKKRHSYEFRYEKSGITLEEREANITTWRNLYGFIVTSTDEEFYANLKNYFVVDSALYYYLFTERYTMVDNRAKNSFWHYGKVYISESEAIELGETESSYYIIDNEAASINDGYRYDLTFGYDMDTALGIDNTGDYVFSYGKEDTDYYVDGDPTSDYVFRAADSVFFCRLRDLFPSEMQAMFKDREEKNAWSSTSLINQWDNAQAQFPEELWRLDYERKYYRTYLGLSIDKSINTGEGKGIDKTFLIGKFFGRKKYARRAFEINQEIYFATKYFGNRALSDVFWIRGNVPIGGTIKPNYSLTLVPYSKMYVCVKYGSTGIPIHKKVNAGEECYFENNSERMDFIYVYGASFIQEVGDLSRCYVGDNNFSAATRLQRLVIGSTEEGYQNTFMKEVLVANNPLLEHLDLRQVSGIDTIIDVSSCSNLKELYAEGTNAKGVIFANGGLLQIAHIPAVTSLIMKNLNYITDFDIEGYNNLELLNIENTPFIDEYEIVVNSPKLNSLRLIGINWNLGNTLIFDRLLTIGGIDSMGIETDLSVLTGTSLVTIAGNQKINIYKEAWPSLEIIPGSLIEEFKVTYINDDADNTVLYETYVEQGALPIRPEEEGLIDIPTLESTEQYDYTFTGWENINIPVTNNKTLKAQYSSKTRKYVVVWYDARNQPIQSEELEYGKEAIYTGPTPTDVSGEENYYYRLFAGWDKSTGFLRENLNVYPTWESGTLPSDGTELKDMAPIEIYAVAKAKRAEKINPDLPSSYENGYFEIGDSFNITTGVDFKFKNVKDKDLNEYLPEHGYFDGSNAVETDVYLFGEKDTSFTLAVDLQFVRPEGDMTLLSCGNKALQQGFRLYYYKQNGSNHQIRLAWGPNAITLCQFSSLNNMARNLIVLRHIKGDRKLRVHLSHPHSSMYTEGFGYTEINLENVPDWISSPIVIGGVKNGTGFQEQGRGLIPWCKIWFDDLGFTNGKLLAYYHHEDIQMKYYGSNRYATTENEYINCEASFIAGTMLEVKARINDIRDNSCGWHDSILRRVLNQKIYKSLPIVWQNIIKQVKIPTTAGGNSTSIILTDDYLYSPSCIEYHSNSGQGYENEGRPIPFLTSDTLRARKPKINPPDDFKIYTNSTVDPSGISINNIKSGDMWTSSSYYRYYLTLEEYDRYPYWYSEDWYAEDGKGVWLPCMNYFWLRSPNLTGSSNTSDNYYHHHIFYQHAAISDVTSTCFIMLCFSI